MTPEVADATAAPALEDLKERVANTIRSNRELTLSLSHRIHATPEVGWEEHAAAEVFADFLSKEGFATTVGPYDIPTSVEATSGSGDAVVAICAEYDALPGIGHACGHNMIAAMSAAAAVGLASVSVEAGVTVTVLGTPAEEHGGGKVSLLKAGAFEGVTFSLMAHGSTGDDIVVEAATMTALDRFEVTFIGRAAHAAAAPDKGINAGAAATLALTAIGLMRQMIPASTRVNAYVSHGGETTNVIPERTVIQVEVRAFELEEWRELKPRVLACFEGAAIATGCSWSQSRTTNPYAPMRHDPVLAAHWNENLTALGRTLSTVNPLGGGSTDMGNVSQVVPAIHGMISVPGSSAVPHHPDFATVAITPEADATVIDGAIALAWTVLDAAIVPESRSYLLSLQAARDVGATRDSLEN